MTKLEQNRDALGFRGDASSGHVADGHCRAVRHWSADGGVPLLERTLVVLGESIRGSSSAAPGHNADRPERAVDKGHRRSCGSPPESPPPAGEGSRQIGWFRRQSISTDLNRSVFRESPGSSIQTTSGLSSSRRIREPIRISRYGVTAPGISTPTTICTIPSKTAGRRPARRRSLSGSGRRRGKRDVSKAGGSSGRRSTPGRQERLDSRVKLSG